MKWWSNRSDPERFDLYTRWSLYLLFAVVPLGVLGLASNSGAGSASMVALVLLAVLQAAVSVAMLSQTITHYLGGSRPGLTLLTVLAMLSLVGVGLSFTAPGVSFAGDSATGIWLPYLFAIAGIAAVSPMLTNRQLLLGSVGLGALVCAAAFMQSAQPGQAIATGVSISISSVSVTLAFRLSVRMLQVVWQIERSRTVESALAVAEERLRFSRDLHDVLGRNLSVMAVKSELASELVRRSRPEAAAEIAEVNRIAQESLREVRAVVRGYREADFATELAGARGILAAAGISCQVNGDPTMLPVEIQKTLGWVVREATTNVLRHSQARTCTIEILNDIEMSDFAQSGDVAVLTVDNDGVPEGGLGHDDDLSASGIDHPGSGLSGLRERLMAMGGTVRAGPTDAGRFRLVASIPLQRSTGASTLSDSAAADGSPVSLPAASDQR